MKSLRSGQRFKKQLLLNLFISLLVLLFFVPRVGDAITHGKSAASISASTGKYALLPFPIRVSNSFRQVKNHENDTYGKFTSPKEATVPLWLLHSSLSYNATADYISGLDMVLRGSLQQACHLLDMPPPSPHIA